MKRIIILLFLLGPLISYSQILKPGQAYKNESSDTLIIVSAAKIRAAVITKREFKIALQEIEKSNEIILNLQEQNKTLEDKCATQKEIVDSYEAQITGSETHAENMKKEAKKQKRQKLIAMGGSAVLLALSIFILL